MEIKNQMKKTNRTIKLIVAGVLVWLFASCQDLSVFVDHLDDEVKLANDRYLEVEETFPEQNDQNLSPRLNISVKFDRDVNPEALREYIKISQKNLQNPDADSVIFNSDSMELDFDLNSKELNIFPKPFLNGGEKITVSISKGAVAQDGSGLRDPVAWSFYTVKMPVGEIDIDDGVDVTTHTLPGYTNQPSPNYIMTWSNAYFYETSDDEVKLQKFLTERNPLSQPTDGPAGDKKVAYTDWSFGGAGDRSLHVLFYDDKTGSYSVIESDSVFFDDTPPSPIYTGVDIASRTNTTVTRTVNPLDDGSGFQKVVWSSSPTGAVFGTSDGVTTTIRGPSGSFVENLNIKATVYDKAGNSSEDVFVFNTWDSEPPKRPVVTSVNKNTGNPNLVWNWGTGGYLHVDVSGGFSRRYGLSINGGKTLWNSWYSDSDGAYSITASSSSKPKAIGWYRYSLQVRELDGLGNISLSDTEYVDFQSVRPFYDITINYHGRVIDNAILTIDWPDIPGGLSFGESYSARYRKVGATSWKSAAMGHGSLASIPIKDTGVGDYEWQYQVSRVKLPSYTSPLFVFTITNN